MIRKFYLTTSLFVLCILFVLSTGWNFLQINRGLKQIIVAHLRSTLGDNCTIDRFSMGFGALNLEGVHLAFDDAPYELRVEQLKVGYSLRSLIRGGPISEKTAEEITLSRPHLVIRSKGGQTLPESTSFELSDDAEKMYRALIKEYDFIKRITVADGEIEIVEEGKEQPSLSVSGLNGWVYTNGRRQAWVRLAGHLFDAENYNLAMYGQLDLERGGVDFLNVTLHDYELSNAVHFLLPKGLEVKSGTIEGEISITEKLQPERGFEIGGRLSVHNGSLHLPSEHLLIEKLEAVANLNDSSLELKESSLTINGSPARLTGKVGNLLHPDLALRLHSDNLNLNKFLTRLLPEKKLPFGGETAVEVVITNPEGGLRLTGSLRSSQLSFFNKAVDSVSVDFSLDEQTLAFPAIYAAASGTHFSGSGNIDLTSPQRIVNFEMQGGGDFTSGLHALGLRLAKRGDGHSKLRVFGPILNPVGNGSFSLNIEGKAATRLAAGGTFRYSLGQCTFHLASADDSLQVDASIDSLFSRTSLTMEVTNVQKMFAFSNNPIVRLFKNRYQFNLQTEGRTDSLGFKMTGYRKRNYKEAFSISSVYLNRAGKRQVDNRIVLLPNSRQSASGSFKLLFEQGMTKLRDLDVGGWITGSFDFSNSNSYLHTGKLNISGLPLPVTLALAGKPIEGNSGLLYGQVTLEGECEQPQFSGNLWLLDAFVNDIGPMKGSLDFTASREHLEVKKLTVEDNESLNLIATGKYNFRTRQVDASIAGSHVRVENIVDLFSNTKGVVAGDAIIQVNMHGKAPEIPVFGSVIVSNPRFLMLKFDEVVLNFGSQDAPNGSFVSDRVINAGWAKLTHGDDFVLEGPAKLPLQADVEQDISLSGDGNFLAMLPDLADVFGESESEGHLDLKMAGLYTRPDLRHSKLTFTKGKLKFNSVIKHIDELEANLQVLDDDYFLQIAKLDGTIKGQHISLTNTNNVAGLDHGSYEALRIGGDDLNLGALFLHTDPDGIPLSIPGLMDKGDTGRYAFDGYVPGESFFITGPWQRPVVRGKIVVRHANLRFPFDEGQGEGNPVVMNIMDNINWDVYAVADKDARYVTQFGTGVYVNMEVDKKNSKLDFKGILKDSTFTIGGKVESSRGDIEYLDLNFRVEKVGAEWTRPSLDPIVYGRAWTVVRDTLLNVPNDVYLTLVTTDDLTRQEVSSGRWDRIQVRVSSENPAYQQTQSELMASLGYSSDTIDDQARKVVGSSTDKFLFRPILRPIERQIERGLSLDFVRFSYAIAQNFLDSNVNNGQLSTTLALLRSSRLSLGKYISSDVYLLYTGELKAGIGLQFQKRGVGLEHVFGLEYRLGQRWQLQMEYDYNTLLETHKDDKKLRLRHSFPF